VSKADRPVPIRDGWVLAGLVLAATSSAVSSFAGLRSLAVVSGWHPLLAALFPACIDSYAATSMRVWLAASTRSKRARRFARWNTIWAILLSLAGNATAHLIAAGLVAVSWIVVVVVGAVPPVILALTVELAVLRGQVDEAPGGLASEQSAPQAGPVVPTTATPAGDARSGRTRPSRPAVRTPTGGQGASGDELRAAARAADEAHRVRTGRPISRDELRRTLGVSGARATEVARWLKQAREPAVPVETVGAAGGE
jgi:uncharacterized protein DUF2637